MASPFSYKNDNEEDLRASPEETAKRTAQQLQEQEQQSGYDRDFNELTSPEHQAKDGKSGDGGGSDSTDAARDSEENGGWKNNTSSYGGNKSKGGKQLSSLNVRAILKKRGPLGLIALLGLGGGLTGALLFSPGLILVQMKEALTDRFNTQFASMDTRYNHIIAKKVTGSTSGICGAKITIKCKYSTISESQAEKLKNAGIEVKGDQKFGSRVKPSSYEFNGKSLSPQEFALQSQSDPALKSALNKAYSPKYAGFADKIWTKVATKLGVTKQRALPDGDDDAKTKALDDEVKNGQKIDISKDGVTCDGDTCKDAEGRELTAEQKAARQAAIEASQEVVDESAESAASDAIAGVENGAKAGVNGVASFIKVTGAVDTACQAYSAVRGLGYAAKTVRAIQLARYAMVFVNTADQIKAGTAKPEDVAYLGGILTNVAYDAVGAAKRKAAMDSAGMKYALYGETSGFRGKGSSYISQFMAGGGLTGDLIYVTDYINNLTGGNPKKVCGVLSNGWVQAGSVAAGIALMLIPGVNVAVSAADVAKGVLSVSAGIGMAILPDLLKAIVAGNVTKGVVGEDSGNAIASGFGVIGSETAQAGGNATMSPDDAVAYLATNTDMIAKTTAEEAKTLSPLDPSNKDTFLGSIVNKLLPVVSSTGSIGNPLTAFSSLASSSLSSILPSASAISTQQEQDALNVCNDPDYKQMGLATDPFCNLVYGIPVQYLNRDPDTVADALAGQYDEETGEPVAKSEYASYVDKCINREVPIGSNGSDGSEPNDGTMCKIDDNNANYYLFYMDQRVDGGLDGYDGSAATTTDDSSDSTDTTTDTSDGSTDQGVVLNSLTAYVAPQKTAPVSATSTAIQLKIPQLSSGWYWSVA